MGDIVDRLKAYADINDGLGAYTEANCAYDAVAEIERLREKCNQQAMMLRRLNPEKFPDTLFISGIMGEKDNNNMPEKILVVPAYGVDFSYVYVRTDKIVGPEW